MNNDFLGLVAVPGGLRDAINAHAFAQGAECQEESTNLLAVIYE